MLNRLDTMWNIMNIRNKKKMEIVIRIMMAKNEIINEHYKNATYLNINRKSRETHSQLSQLP